MSHEKNSDKNSYKPWIFKGRQDGGREEMRIPIEDRDSFKNLKRDTSMISTLDNENQLRLLRKEKRDPHENNGGKRIERIESESEGQSVPYRT
ncbi:hypothetical protein DPMN_022658 [Dreissena polymorpha]|uniref:Uncharacterized protein n=1 Tax=Dreissena polymorpha TaxID=45954 RepID=A0A9D4SCJ4_DREPO|nr:hypothetical protein DPMN_022658 [Dreissena polymorpha]